MRKQKRWIALFLTVTLVSGVTGCSTGKENATGGTLPIEKGTALADVFDSEEYAVEEAEEEEIPVSTYEGLTFIKPGTLQEYLLSDMDYDEAADFTIVTPTALSLYSIDGIKVAEVAEGITLHVIGTSSRYAWVKLENPVAGTKYENLYLLRDENVDPVITAAKEKADSVLAADAEQSDNSGNTTSANAPVKNTPSKNATSSNASSNTSSGNTAAGSNSVSESAAVATEETTDRYTPEEAIAVYRSIMEAGGMIWDPSLPDNFDENIGQHPIEDWYLYYDNYNGADFGSGYIDLKKGMPEAAAYTDLEACRMGDTAGTSWTRYYVRILSYDELYVKIVGWDSP